MAAEWRTFSLDELYEFSSGLSKPRSAFGSGYPFLSFKDIFYNSSVPSHLNELVNSTEQERTQCSVRRGDVFLTRTSETMDELGMSCVALRDVPNATFNGFAKRLRPKSSSRVVPEYARYYFRAPAFREAVTAMSSMSTRASLNNEMLSRLSISVPPAEDQGAIGQILGTLDDKIELDRRMNETLEAMARALFKSWFVDFDPVRAKAEGRDPGLPPSLANLFPDSFEDSKLGEIPKGWSLGLLDEVVQQLRDQVEPLESPDALFHHFSIPAFDEAQNPKHDYGVSIRSSKWRVPTGAILLSKLNPEIERVWMVDVRPGEVSVCSTEFLVLHARSPFTRGYVYCLARSALFRQQIQSLVTGTSKSHQRAHVESILKLPLVVPPPPIVESFTSVTDRLLARVLESRREVRTLAALRDTLLPKLISGEVRVKNPACPDEAPA